MSHPNEEPEGNILVRINVKPSHLLALSGIALALSLGTAGLVGAQEAQQPAPQFGPRANKPGQQPGAQSAPKAEVVATHGEWKVQCESGQPSAQGEAAKRQCGMVQTAVSEKNPKANLTLVMVRTMAGDKQQINMRVIAPIGVFLPTGVALEIDGSAVGRVPFTRCMPQVCMAFAEASPDTLAKMKKGKQANFIIYEAPGIGLPMKLSLGGFSAALADLEKF
jgi:invasion protein IalB